MQYVLILYYFICLTILVDCVEGYHQVSVVETRLSNSISITERVPRCGPCPLNTYQNQVGGSCVACPDNHITFSTGVQSIDQCIG